MSIKFFIFLETLLCVLSVCACEENMLSSDIATLYIDFKKQDCNATALTLLEGKPARIIGEPFYNDYVLFNQPYKRIVSNTGNSNRYDIFIYDIRPGKKNYTFLIYKTNDPGLGPGFFNRHIDRVLYCEPTFHVRLNQTPLTVAINDVVLTIERTNLSVTDYDAVAHYKFRVGELADISCGKNVEYGKLSLRYRQMETTTERGYQLHTAYALKLQVKLDSRDSGRYLTCRIETKTDYTTVRVYLHSDRESKDDFYILGIPPGHIKYQYKQIKTNNVPTILSEYEYFEGETLNLTCMRNSNSDNMAYFLKWGTDYDEEKSKDNALEQSRPIKQSFVLSSASHNRVLKCLVYESVIDPRDRSEKPKLYLTIALKLTMRKPAEKTTVVPPPIDYEEKPAKALPPANDISRILTMSLVMLLMVIVILAAIVKKRKKKQPSVTNNVNLPVEFADMYPMEEPVATEAQLPLPHTPQEPHHHCAGINDTTMYSEMYYEPSFPRRKTPTYTENEYAYVDCAHLLERHKSPFDAIATKIALEQAKKSNKLEYSNLKEVCRPGHCVLRYHCK